jgi:hypothetical protein
MKRISDKEAKRVARASGLTRLDNYVRAGADAQLASCEKEQEQERRAIGELLSNLWSCVEDDKMTEAIEALKQGTLPEGMVK